MMKTMVWVGVAVLLLPAGLPAFQSAGGGVSGAKAAAAAIGGHVSTLIRQQTGQVSVREPKVDI